MTTAPDTGIKGGLNRRISQIPTGGGHDDGGLTEAADAAGERRGFASREAAPRRRKRQTRSEPTDQINIRAAIPDLDRFVEWCDVNRYSYGEGLRELLRRAGI